MASTPYRAVTLKAESGGEFKLNGQRLKHYYGGSMEVEQELESEKKTTETEDTLQLVSS